MKHNDYHIITAKKSISHDVRNNQHLIDGQWQDSKNSDSFKRLSPAYGCLVSLTAKGSEVETNAAIQAARKAFTKGDWSKSSAKERATLLLKVADLIEDNLEKIATLEVLESGKPIIQAKAEIAGAADIWRYAAALARTLHGESYNNLGQDMLAMVIKQPIGVVSLITPWNFPFLIISQKLPFALAAGCTCVIKPSELTPSSTTFLGELLMQAGVSDGVINIVHGYGQPVGEIMSAHPLVDMISFTGSTGVGKNITAVAANTLKKVSSELGGKNPQVIFADADISSAVDAIVFGIYFNAGECCNSGSKIIVHESIVDEVIDRVVALSKKVPFGDPMHSDTKVGAIISDEHLNKIDTYVQQAINEGGKLELGGHELIIDGLAGKYYAPTVLSHVRSSMCIAKEEVFGPVLSVLTFKTLDEAIALANDNTYGLSAGVWSQNINLCLEFIRSVDAGTVWTNTWMDGFSELPFGGFKESGQGRELGSYGIEEYLEVKTVQLKISSSNNVRTPWVD